MGMSKRNEPYVRQLNQFELRQWLPSELEMAVEQRAELEAARNLRVQAAVEQDEVMQATVVEVDLGTCPSCT